MTSGHKTYELGVQPRNIFGKQTAKLRRQGLVPAVVYGHKVDPVSVSVESRELERVYLRAGTNSLVDLKIGDNGAAQKVFIHDVQRDPVTHSLSHVDFVVVNLTELITTTVPVVLVGEAPAVKNGDGVLIHPLDHLQVRALPAEIPGRFEVDVSELDEVDKAIYVSDIEVPGNVHVLNSPEELVARVNALAVIPEEEEAAEEAAEEEAEETGEAEGESE
jgi:large subunit ribosomal protein L25